jgi:hypothetical protein
LIILCFSLLLFSDENAEQEESRYRRDEFHQQYAVGLNNLVWELMGKAERTQHEDDLMIHAAHTSRYHWSMIGTPVNLQRGEWLISRVYAVLNRPESALYHAHRCMDITMENEIGDFDLAYAYEAMARAYASTGDEAGYSKYMDLATETGNKIDAEENKALFFDDLHCEPWFGMD